MPGSGTAAVIPAVAAAVVEPIMILPLTRPVPERKLLKPTLIALVVIPLLVIPSPNMICSLRMIDKPRALNNTVLGAAFANSAALNSKLLNAEPVKVSPSMVVEPLAVNPPTDDAVDCDWIVVAVSPKTLERNGDRRAVGPIPTERLLTVAVADAPMAVPVEFEVRSVGAQSAGASEHRH